jgi:hypothetical protein
VPPKAPRTCTIEGCEEPHLSRGWCSKHYYRWKRSGDPLTTQRQPPTPADATEKRCVRCGEVKPIEEFGSRKGKVGDKPRGYCWPCEKAYLRERRAGVANSMDRKRSRDWAQRNPGYYLQRKYGITLEDYDRMLKEQGGVCAICRSDDVGNDRAARWHVDHCHNSNKVRGLLCHRCNMGIGYFKDDPARLRAAAEYLERNET